MVPRAPAPGQQARRIVEAPARGERMLLFFHGHAHRSIVLQAKSFYVRVHSNALRLCCAFNLFNLHFEPAGVSQSEGEHLTSATKDFVFRLTVGFRVAQVLLLQVQIISWDSVDSVEQF